MSGHDEKRNISEEQHRRLCAWVFGELEKGEAAAFEAELERSPELRAERVSLEATIGLVRDNLPAETLSDTARATVMAAADEPVATPKWTFLRGGGAGWKVAAGILVLFTGLVLVRTTQRRALLEGWQSEEVAREAAPSSMTVADSASEAELQQELRALGYTGDTGAMEKSVDRDAERSRELGLSMDQKQGRRDNGPAVASAPEQPVTQSKEEGKNDLARNEPAEELYEDALLADAPSDPLPEAELDTLGINYETVPADELAAATREALEGLGYAAGGPAPAGGRQTGTATARSKAGETATDVPRRPQAAAPERVGIGGGAGNKFRGRTGGGSVGKKFVGPSDTVPPGRPIGPGAARPDAPAASGALVGGRMLEDLGYAEGDRTEIHPGATVTGSDGWFLGAVQKPKSLRQRIESSEPVRWTEDQLDDYCRRLFHECRIRPREKPGAMFFRFWGDNPFEITELDRLSTFAVDVDTASYTLARRYLTDGYLPTKAQVRTEEFVNAFDADVPPPTDGETFAVGLELAPSLFGGDPEAWMLRVAVRGKDIDAFERQPLALTFVVDVSGSMKGQRIGLVKQAMALCARSLSTTDSIALVTFNSEPRMLVPMVSGASRGAFENALVGLTPGGSTNVAGGLMLGYELAAAAITPGAVNRVILLSDGVGNVGTTDQNEILARVAEYKAKGIYLNAVGVGMGNHNDVFLEQLADKGDGLCHYVDSLEEARRVFVDEFTKTLQPIARDVKVQVEFDPSQVESYRLLGYENRAVADKDFRNDAVDAGEINAGHQVVALYELVLRSTDGQEPLATARLRWKPPFAIDRAEDGAEARAQAEKASEIEAHIHGEDALNGYDSASYGYRRDVLVAQFAEFLRRSRHTRTDSYKKLLVVTKELRATTENPELDELYRLMHEARSLIERRDRLHDHRILEAYDELCELHFLEARRESLEDHGLGTDADDTELRTELDDVRTELQERIRRMLRERHVDQASPEDLEKLRDLGYTDDR